jgi:hypothetical protein
MKTSIRDSVAGHYQPRRYFGKNALLPFKKSAWGKRQQPTPLTQVAHCVI